MQGKRAGGATVNVNEFRGLDPVRRATMKRPGGQAHHAWVTAVAATAGAAGWPTRNESL